MAQLLAAVAGGAASDAFIEDRATPARRHLLLVTSDGPYLLPPWIDEPIQMTVALLPLLCLLWHLARRTCRACRRRCFRRRRLLGEGLRTSHGGSPHALDADSWRERSSAYSPAMRDRDRAEELAIKSRVISGLDPLQR